MCGYFSWWFAACLATSAGLVHAADSKFLEASRPTIMRAIDVIAPPPRNIIARSDLVFHQLESAPARALAKKGFQIRVFELVGVNTQPSRLAWIEDCDMYSTIVIGARSRADGTISLGQIDETWLRMSASGGSARAGRYLFVFEEVGAIDPLFRLRKTSAEKYFAQGFELTVDVSASIPLAEIQRKFENGNIVHGTLFQRATYEFGTVPCFEFKARKVAAEEGRDSMLASGELLACSADPDVRSPAS